MKQWMFFLSSLLIITVDQISKHIASIRLELYQSDAVMPMLNLTLAHNTGAAFSFLNGAGAWHHWFFMGFSFAVSVALIVWFIRIPRTERLQSMALSLLLGGALGNLIDRVRFGYVIDFIDVYYKNYHWPIFNIADTAITLGTALLMYALFLRDTNSKKCS